jgi:tRNA-binding EMAP/Myf-like protein
MVGRVVEIRPHPGGDLIWLAKVDIGAEYQPRIVYGGVPIVKEGSLVPVATPGTWLPPTKNKPGPYKIRCRNYRGVRSEGMLCSLAELGWDSSVTNWVALLKDSVGLQVGESLEDRYGDWKRIVVPPKDFLKRGEFAFPNRSKRYKLLSLLVFPRLPGAQERTRRAMASEASLTLSPASGPPSSIA